MEHNDAPDRIKKPDPASPGAGYDKRDELIMKNLVMNAKLSARQLSLAMGISTVTVLTRVKRLEQEKIIKGYSAVLDHEKVGYGLTAVIEVVAKKDKIIEIEEEIAQYENVCAVYDVTGSTDMIVIAKFKSRPDLSKFVKDLGIIPHVSNTITHIVLNTTKEDFRLV